MLSTPLLVPDRELALHKQNRTVFDNISLHLKGTVLIGSHLPRASPLAFRLPGLRFFCLHPALSSRLQLCLSSPGRPTPSGEWPVPAQYLLGVFQLHNLSQWPPTFHSLPSHSQSIMATPSSVSLKASMILFQPGSQVNRPPVFKSQVTPPSSVFTFAFPKPNLHYNYSF